MIPAAKLERMLDRFASVEAQMSSGVAGDDFVKLSKEYAELEPVAKAAMAYRVAQDHLTDAQAMASDADSDAEMRGMAEQEAADLKRELEKLERVLLIALIPKDAADNSSAIIEIRAGTGGDEAALFAADLMGMYTRYCQLQGWKVEVMELSESDLGGVREAVLNVDGVGVFAKLKFESGVHRVQRVPVTEAGGRIHT
ncbi:MAG: PCRF domain-containing protein, partial [Rhizomicrobium sp.]